MSRRFCETFEKIVCERYLGGESATSIGKTFGKNATSITRVLKRNGISIRQCVGENHPSWKGGRVIKGDGYIGVWKPDHERADNRGYVFEHTLVMEEKIGRLPKKGEVVHHVNLIKTDNRPENLYLCNHRVHISLHRELEKMVVSLIDDGIIYFDHESGEYKKTT